MNGTEPVYPQSVKAGGNAVSVGISKREYFAALAMQSYSSALVQSIIPAAFNTPTKVATNAVTLADALIAALSG